MKWEDVLTKKLIEETAKKNETNEIDKTGLIEILRKNKKISSYEDQYLSCGYQQINFSLLNLCKLVFQIFCKFKKE
ncbi:MAG: hypothetical protein HPY72_02645 [Anaerolineae bacterium]|nr:hypothetical protein [Anaerolineae bacterium]